MDGTPLKFIDVDVILKLAVRLPEKRMASSNLPNFVFVFIKRKNMEN
jgi:hypothetical protein